MEEANVLKLHWYSGKVTYLVCEDVGSAEDASVRMRVKVTLPKLAVELFDYSQWSERLRLGVRGALLGSADGP
jgi:hypothetical protein